MNPNQLEELRQSTMDAYKNLYWTRIIALDHFQPDEQKRWPMAPDLADEYDVLFMIEEDDLPKLEPHFDMQVFMNRHPQPQADAWRLMQDRVE